MAIANYSDLQSSIAGWLNRDDLTGAIQDFIFLAEADFARTIRHRFMVKRSDATLDSEYSATPSDWVQSVQLMLKTNPAQSLEYVTNEAMNDLKGAGSAAGRPLFYTHVGTEIQTYPAPDGDGYTGELVYYAKIPNLSDTEPTNWLLTLAPDIYLYGALIQSAPYLRDDERLGVWASMYQRKIEDMVVSDQRTRGQTSVRMRTRALQ